MGAANTPSGVCGSFFALHLVQVQVRMGDRYSPTQSVSSSVAIRPSRSVRALAVWVAPTYKIHVYMYLATYLPSVFVRCCSVLYVLSVCRGRRREAR